MVLPTLPGWAMAHAAHEHAPLSWTFDPLTASLILLSTAAYILGLVNIQRAHRGAILKPWRIAAFFAGTLLLVLALLSPLDQLAASYFSAHMSQHLLLADSCLEMVGGTIVGDPPQIGWL